MTSFKHKTPVQVRFKDYDGMGHINNANHLTYIELARLKYFEHVIGPGSDWVRQRALILARVEIDYTAPILLGDQIAVFTRCSAIGKKSFELSWQIAEDNKETPRIFAKGKAVLVCYDYEKETTVEVPAENRRKLQDFEGLPAL